MPDIKRVPTDLSAPVAPPPAAAPASKPRQAHSEHENPLITIILVMVLTALVTGGSVYFGMKSSYDDLKSSTDSQIKSLTEQVDAQQQLLAQAQQSAANGATVTAVAPSPSPSPSATPATAANTFDPTTAKVGDKVAGMTIKSIAPYDATQGNLSSMNAKVAFTGDVTVTGNYEYMAATDSGTPAQVCLTSVDTVSQSKLPQLTTDIAARGFCFSNQDLAKTKFGTVGSKGTVTITIRNYILNASGTASLDQAQLVSVLTRKQS